MGRLNTGEAVTGESILKCEGVSKNATKKARKMTCPELFAKIAELTSREKRGRAGTKGLYQRFRDYLGDDATHGPQICNQQRSLRAYLAEFIAKGCGDPPEGATELSERPIPVPAIAPASETEEDGLNVDATDVVKVGAGVGLVYLTYRVVRFLPSLLPPLWGTAPANLAIP